MTREYRVTFGQKYRHEPHPHLDGAHPNGWATVWAEDEHQARKIAHAHLVDAWDDVYDLENFSSVWADFPLGELIVLNPEMAP